MTSRTPFGPVEYETDDAMCPTCGGDAEWADCTDCGGDGYYDGDELGREDDPPCNMCNGDGGHWFCRDCEASK